MTTDDGAPAPVRVVLADDEAMIRAGVRAILATDPGIEVVAEAGDGRAAVELVRAHRPSVALLDIRMPKLDGLSAAAEIRRLVPQTATVMLTTFGEDDHVARALGHGASGFLLKSGDPRELIAGVHAVADGGRTCRPGWPAASSSWAAGGWPGVRRPGTVRRGSPTESGRCSRWSGRACPTPRSPAGCTWSRAP